jgi:RNA polymerase primary sigma factor
MELEDLVEAGNLGLIAAADRFDPSRNVHFATYARFWIKLEIHNALSNTARTVRIPIYLVHLIRRWRKTAAALEESLGRTPTHDEICRRMKLSKTQRRRLAEGLRFVRTPTFSDLGDDVDMEQSLMDERAAPPDAHVAHTETMNRLSRMLERLDQKEASVLRRRFGLHGCDAQTYRAISEDLGLGCKRVRRMEQRGMRRLRTLLSSHV